MNTKIVVATHKNYVMPADSDLYLPVFVGKALHPDVNDTFQGDNTGDNISVKNSSYNELTALYWAWKNISADAVGLVHYRRYLSVGHKADIATFLNKEQTDSLLSQADIILPKKRNYYIESNYSHYIHAHHRAPIDTTREIIAEDYPKYLASFDDVMKRRSAHMFNMFVMKSKWLDLYCTWLFDILGKLETRIDVSEYDTYEARVYGFISERLLDVWLETLKPSFVEVNYVHMESEHWLKKGSTFLERKLHPQIRN
ncbi:DUF4422 domain-containing protein [Furfurilactobacillus siliginis]|uniref:Glycosyl transferase n=1 Tax=Furfurilactobacillus siliginis TaxID=348151 RepID=A0A0R2L7D7_9LACO|nr:DUF4422 domain-containing protein [Furfurilactobacillus siliginis]KRN95324.1 glycosyltransferase [Furfurilactobacillus siliginis]GEK28278.1 glycosyl transferase [Furfurilactobacillus siliginis]